MDTDTAVKEFEEKVEKVKHLSPEERQFMYKGTQYPSTVTSPETLQALENFEARADDILLVSYPKCGFNWMFHILNSLAITAGTTKKGNEMMPPLLEFRKPVNLQVFSSMPSQRILGTHLHPDNLPKSFIEKKVKNQLSAAASRATVLRMHTGAILIPTTFAITFPTSSYLKSFLRQIQDLSVNLSEK
ncbi:ST6B1 Sulfotransferase, partial [Polypterus senegalus]